MENKLKERKEEQYGAEDLLTQEDIGKYVGITTVLNTKIEGKITRLSRNQIEIKQFPTYRTIIINKHTIVSLFFLEFQPTEEEELDLQNRIIVSLQNKLFEPDE